MPDVRVSTSFADGNDGKTEVHRGTVEMTERVTAPGRARSRPVLSPKSRGNECLIQHAAIWAAEWSG